MYDLYEGTEFYTRMKLNVSAYTQIKVEKTDTIEKEKMDEITFVKMQKKEKEIIIK